MRKCLEQSLIEGFLVLQHLICVPSVLLFYTQVTHVLCITLYVVYHPLCCVSPLRLCSVLFLMC